MSTSSTAHLRKARLFSLILVIVVSVAACGGGGTADTTTATSTAPQGTSAPSGGSSSLTPADIVGTWDNGVYVLTVLDGTEYTIAASDAPDTVLMSGFIAAMGSTITLATGTNGECPGQTGNYKGSLEGDTLTLTVSNDPCQARAEGLAAPLTRSA
jgi:hypothetical protein